MQRINHQIFKDTPELMDNIAYVTSHLNINELVYKDRYVEFFIDFERDLNHYNLEFSSTATVLWQYGCRKSCHDLHALYYQPWNIFVPVDQISIAPNSSRMVCLNV